MRLNRQSTGTPEYKLLDADKDKLLDADEKNEEKRKDKLANQAQKRKDELLAKQEEQGRQELEQQQQQAVKDQKEAQVIAILKAEQEEGGVYEIQTNPKKLLQYRRPSRGGKGAQTFNVMKRNPAGEYVEDMVKYKGKWGSPLETHKMTEFTDTAGKASRGRKLYAPTYWEDTLSFCMKASSSEHVFAQRRPTGTSRFVQIERYSPARWTPGTGIPGMVKIQYVELNGNRNDVEYAKLNGKTIQPRRAQYPAFEKWCFATSPRYTPRTKDYIIKRLGGGIMPKGGASMAAAQVLAQKHVHPKKKIMLQSDAMQNEFGDYEEYGEYDDFEGYDKYEGDDDIFDDDLYQAAAENLMQARDEFETAKQLLRRDRFRKM